MVAGNPYLRSYTGTVEAQAISFACLNYNGPATPETNGLPTVNCPNGIRAQVYFPSCWNGQDLDSADHKSHIVYPSTYNAGQCPSGFDTRTISIFYEVIWNTPVFSDMWYGNEQPFVFSTGDPTGFGYHGDFVSDIFPILFYLDANKHQLNGWDVPTLQNAIDNCKDGDSGSDANHDGDINYCPPLLPLESNNEANGCLVPPSVSEQVSGVLPALPGCNPIQAGPGQATPQTGCGAPTTIGKPQLFYTDVTASKGFEYIGCGLDIAGQARTLSGPNTSNNNMTVENCVDFCNGQGQTIAGLEYSTQCFCGDSVPADRAPTPGIVGNCMMPCSGDSTEHCGGGGTISLYQKCSGTCQNVQEGVGNSTASSGSSGSAASAASPASSGAPVASSAPASGSPTGSSSGSSPGSSSAQAAAANPSGGSGSENGVSKSKDDATPAGSASASVSPDSSDVPSGASPVPAGSAPGSSSSPGSTPAPSNFAVSTNRSSSVNLPQGWRSVGCYVDPVNPRALTNWGWWGQPMTSSGCANFCDQKGYSFAGTENAGQCFCDNTVHGGQAAPASDCNMPCVGSANETCGGSARLCLFTKVPAPSSRRSLRRHIARNHKAAN